MAGNVPAPSQETASLIRRLAGPSTGKAGLAKDQTEINKVISEASKGSKFYENEKKKDKDLTERIAKILKLRDEAMRNADMAKVEASVDSMLLAIEAQRDLSQIIVHIDMDAFFANVELLDDPTLLGKPFGVGFGVLTTASYEARKYGVRSGMPTFIAKKLCPDLIIKHIKFARYNEMSGKVMEIFHRYDPTMLVAGCDEGYLNITKYCEERGMTAEECVAEMRQKVSEETNLTASAGIAPNKMLAKICSDKNKPNGQFLLPFEPEAIKEFMQDLSIRKIQGIGRVNERLLESIGIKTCGDIYTHRAVVSLLDKQFGLYFLLRTHLGIGSNNVQPYGREERKSIGAERTFNPLGDKDRILEKLDEVAEELEDDMNRSGWTGRTVTLKYKLETYQVFTRARSLDKWITTKEELFEIGKELILAEYPDLRASDDKTSGIKRYFESSGAQVSNKKAKIEQHSPQVIDLAEDEELDAMPGFHEHNEEDIEAYEATESAVELEEGKHEPKPASTTAAASSDSIPRAKPASTKPASSSNRKPKPKAEQKQPANPSEELQCPICSKFLETDNQGLNAHIDFCLSRDAIWQAQGESNGGARANGKAPNSRGKRKG